MTCRRPSPRALCAHCGTLVPNRSFAKPYVSTPSRSDARSRAAAALRGAGDAYWAEQTEILRLAAEGWVAFARGERDQGLALLREAAEREGRTDKHPVTPGPLMPAREQLGDMLLLMDRPAEARREFEAGEETGPRGRGGERRGWEEG